MQIILAFLSQHFWEFFRGLEREKEEREEGCERRRKRNTEGRERGERMRDNISESPLNISKLAISKFQNFSERAALVLKKRSPAFKKTQPFTMGRAALFKKAQPFSR